MMMGWLPKQMKSQDAKANWILININVMGSCGPIRFFVYENQLVASVIDTTLKTYAREGRLPFLGSDPNDFLLYCPANGWDALQPFDTIGSQGGQNFMLCKKPAEIKKMEDSESFARTTVSRRGGGTWKSWIHKSFHLKISSH